MIKQNLLIALLGLTLSLKSQYIPLDQLISLRSYSLANLESYLTGRNWTFVDAAKETSSKMSSATYAYGRNSFQSDKAILYIDYKYSSTFDTKRISYQLHKPTEYNKLITRAKELGFSLYRSIIEDKQVVNIYKKGNIVLRFKSLKDFQSYENVTLYSVMVLTYEDYSGFPEEKEQRKNRLPNISSWTKSTLKEQMNLIDEFAEENSNSIFSYVKDPERSIPFKVDDIKEYEDEVETTYLIIKNLNGKVIAITEIPTSISGDWYIEYTHYFDESGKTFAFKKQTNFFNSGCTVTDEVAYETVTEFYNKDFKQIGKEYNLVDKNDTPLVKSKCNFLYDRPYKRELNLQSLKKRLRLSNI